MHVQLISALLPASMYNVKLIIVCSSNASLTTAFDACPNVLAPWSFPARELSDWYSGRLVRVQANPKS